MERLTINAEPRDKAGKGPARSLRREGGIPAVLYGKGASSPIKLGLKEMKQFIKATSGEKVLVNLSFPDGNNRLALLKEFQFDPIKGNLMHVDFFEVSLTEKVKVTVNVHTTGEPIGVKRDGGILQFGIRAVEVECLPDKIPGHVSVDISSLLTGHSLHVKDLTLPEGVKMLTDTSEVIITVTAPVVEAAPAEAAPEEAKEPELIKKAKTEEKED